MAEQQTNGNWQERYRNALLGVFGNPQLCLDHGQGCVVVDNDGKESVSYTHLTLPTILRV